MAWSTPLTATANTALTAAQWNASVRDNLNETAVAKATNVNGYFVTTAANTIAERVFAHGYDNGADTTASTTYTDLAGGASPTTGSITTGTKALVLLTASMSNSTVNALSHVGFEVSGATSTAAADAARISCTSATANANVTAGGAFIATLNAGSNTFIPKYRASAGTSTFSTRRIIVLSF